MSNQTWTDELESMQLRKLDLVDTAFCDKEWNCENEITHAIEYKLQIGVWRWVFFCDCHMESEQ